MPRAPPSPAYDSPPTQSHGLSPDRLPPHERHHPETPRSRNARTPRMKSLRRKLAAITAGVAIAPLVTVALPAASAYAHGYVTAPLSRQAQCAQRIVQCGQIVWEPQSVEGPKGLKS